MLKFDQKLQFLRKFPLFVAKEYYNTILKYVQYLLGF